MGGKAVSEPPWIHPSSMVSGVSMASDFSIEAMKSSTFCSVKSLPQPVAVGMTSAASSNSAITRTWFLFNWSLLLDPCPGILSDRLMDVEPACALNDHNP